MVARGKGGIWNDDEDDDPKGDDDDEEGGAPPRPCWFPLVEVGLEEVDGS